MSDPKLPYTLGDANVLITGAGQGVGEAAARLLGRMTTGTVVVNDFHLDRAERVAAAIRSDGGRAHAVAADVTDYDSVTSMFRQAVEAAGPVHVLVNNAGNAGTDMATDHLQPFWSTGPSEWGRWLDTNLFGVMNCTHAAIPGMIQAERGRIVTVISDAARLGEPAMAVYSAAKAGAGGFMRSMARALGRYGITANSVSLAATQTPGVAALLEDPKRAQKMLQAYMLPRLGAPDDAAAAIAFLASDAAAWITGQTYAVNGGFSVNS